MVYLRADLTGRIALVTGSARGIGRAIALRFAENGADVVINDIDVSEGMKTVEEIKALGRESMFVQADVGNSEQVSRMASNVLERFRRLDILVNNAGIGVYGVPFQDYKESDWRRVMSVDLDGVFLCSRAFVNQMIKQRKGKIINITSIVGIVPVRYHTAYATAKAGVINLTRIMALELASYGINVNAIAPGSTLTEQTRFIYSDPEKAARVLSHVPLKRPARPEEIASVALFLASDDADYITGHTLVVDGGWTTAYIRELDLI
jgi:NAD(P)-dependent dehydrogenase (short-subunit alcohol dehydrogenase family)